MAVCTIWLHLCGQDWSRKTLSRGADSVFCLSFLYLITCFHNHTSFPSLCCCLSSGPHHPWIWTAACLLTGLRSPAFSSVCSQCSVGSSKCPPQNVNLLLRVHGVCPPYALHSGCAQLLTCQAFHGSVPLHRESLHLPPSSLKIPAHLLSLGPKVSSRGNLS